MCLLCKIQMNLRFTNRGQEDGSVVRVWSALSGPGAVASAHHILEIQVQATPFCSPPSLKLIFFVLFHLLFLKQEYCLRPRTV